LVGCRDRNFEAVKSVGKIEFNDCLRGSTLCIVHDIICYTERSETKAVLHEPLNSSHHCLPLCTSKEIAMADDANDVNMLGSVDPLGELRAKTEELVVQTLANLLLTVTQIPQTSTPNTEAVRSVISTSSLIPNPNP